MTEFASVCVLSYERPEFLKACLESIRDAGAPYELIVHDDGSENPDVRKIIDRLLSEGQISTAILNPPGHNEGVGSAVRRCFAAAQGDLLIKCDQDLMFGSKEVTPDGWLKVINDIIDWPKMDVACVGAFAYHHEPCDIANTVIEQRDEYRVVKDFVGSLFAIPRYFYEMPTIGPITTHADSFSEDVGLKDKIQKAGYDLALPNEDLCYNVGFGYGPSTVCVKPPEGDDPGVQKIHHGPVLFG